MKLNDELKQYALKNPVRFHMPGHKGRGENFRIDQDITEIYGFDKLNEPNGLLLAILQDLSKVYGSHASFLSVGGSTTGILSAVHAAFKPGDEVVIERQAHMSIYHAALICGLRVKYVNQETILTDLEREVSSSTVGVILSSPDYYGKILEDSVYSWVKKRNLLLIIDGAHGAHLGLLDQDFENHNCDILVHSLHKTLPAITGVGAIHLMSKRISPWMFQRSLQMFQTSSPSYLMMASAERCLDWMHQEGHQAMKELLENIAWFEGELQKTPFIRKKEMQKFDPTKILLQAKSHPVDYEKLEGELFKKNIVLEMANEEGLLLMTSPFNTKEDFKRTIIALEELIPMPINEVKRIRTSQEIVLSLREAWSRPSKWIELSESQGKISADFLVPYPPGVPLVCPGEKITEQILSNLEFGYKKIIGIDQNRRIRIVGEYD